MASAFKSKNKNKTRRDVRPNTGYIDSDLSGQTQV